MHRQQPGKQHESSVVGQRAPSLHGSVFTPTLRDPLKNPEALQDQIGYVGLELAAINIRLEHLAAQRARLTELTAIRRELALQQDQIIAKAAEPALEKLKNSVPLKYIGWGLERLRDLRIIAEPFAYFHISNREELKKLAAAHPHLDARKVDSHWGVIIVSAGSYEKMDIACADLPALLPSVFRRESRETVTINDVLASTKQGFGLGFYNAYDLRFSPLRSRWRAEQLKRELLTVARERCLEETAENLMFAAKEFCDLTHELIAAEDELGRLDKYVAARRAEREDCISRKLVLEADRTFLNRISEVRSASVVPVIEKRGGQFGTYSLYYMGGPVVYSHPDGYFEMVSTRRKKDPFVLEKASMEAEDKFRAEKFAGLSMSEFCTHDGIPLQGQARKEASAVFEIVRCGVRLFPDESIVRRVKEHMESQSNERREREVQPRTFGQEYLTSLRPSRIEPGALFAGSAMWKVYYIGDCIVAEADESNNATFIGTPDALSLFMSMSRDRLLKERPPALLGHIVHPGSDEAARQLWKNRVDAIIKMRRGN